ncbi:MAG: ribosomal-processing cysteine protease Prp, partial [Erysipelotrichaceae bacterium]|nr:ribosomal-processing cysteine protease Prp [Erysipelotrichaceae bacterium]
MIKAAYEVKDGSYLSLDVRGHADYGEYGKDLICASVSSILFGFMNALDELQENVEIRQTENHITVA